MIKDGLWDAFHNYHMGITAENVAEKFQVTREEQDKFALKSQEKALTAKKENKFKKELLDLKIMSKKVEVIFNEDEHPRDGINLEALSRLKPVFKKGGTVTAGNASGINDGAAAVTLMSSEEAEKRGISADRLIFAESLPNNEHLARHKLADLFLDTFNFNAGATASDVLWMDQPIITKSGKGFATRVAGSLLKGIDVPELITHTTDEYEKLMLELAMDSERLVRIKGKIEKNRLTKPLFNTELFTKCLENGLNQAYQLSNDKKIKSHIYVQG